MTVIPAQMEAGDSAEEGGKRSPSGGNGNGEVARQPFTAAALELEKPAGIATSDQMTGSVQEIGGPFLIPPSGYLRNLILEADATGGAAGMATVAADEDAPFNSLVNLAYRDIGGDAVVVPVNGYDLMLINKYGGYKPHSDPRKWPDFSAVDTDGDFAFTLEVPLEIVMRSAFGALANQDARSAYQLEAQLNGSGSVYGTAPDTLPTVAVNGILDSWSQPLGSDPVTGQPNQTKPPTLPSFQRWAREVKDIASGDQQIQIDTVGNFIRAIIFKLEAPTGTRSDSNWPSTVTLRLDDHDLLRNARVDRLRNRMAHRYHWWDGGSLDAAGGFDTGVFVIDFAHDLDGTVGAEERRGYLRTTKQTDLVLEGNFGAAGQLTVLVNEVIPAQPRQESGSNG